MEIIGLGVEDYRGSFAQIASVQLNVPSNFRHDALDHEAVGVLLYVLPGLRSLRIDFSESIGSPQLDGLWRCEVLQQILALPIQSDRESYDDPRSLPIA